MQGVAEDEDEGHGAVGESAVDEAGLAAPPFRIPLADDVDARRIDQAGTDTATEREAEVGEHDAVLGEAR